MFTAELPQNFMPIAERVINGEKALISYPKDEKIIDLVVITGEEYNQLQEMLKKEKKQAGKKFIENLKSMQEKSIAIGNDKITLEETNEIISEIRRETSKQT